VDTNNEQERRLVEAAQRGDREAFGRLVEVHARQVFRVCYQVTNSEFLAEDAVQETFVKAWRKILNFDGRSQLSTWLHRIAVNSALEMLRREGRHKTEEVPDEAASPDWVDDAPSLERVSESAKVFAHFEAALGDLSSLERTALVLRHYQELSIAEICDALGLRPSAAKQAIFRAVKKMRVALADFQSGDEPGRVKINACD
jgi:RNA polymerase sigma-70 factor, ECF subfamily